MKIHEYQAKDILRRYGIPVQEGTVATSPADVHAIATSYGVPVVVKAQVHVGGRGKAGGVKFAPTPAAAEEKANAIFGMDIKGITVNKVLVTRAADIAKEYYLGLVLDRAAKTVTVLASAEGGVEIEEVAKTDPDKIISIATDPFLGLQAYQVREIAFKMNIPAAKVRQFTDIALALYKAFVENDASLLEINPLVVTEQGDLLALDAKMVYDDNALFRQRNAENLRDRAEEEAAENEAREAGLSYVKLEGDIGCVVNGAGLAMATMDSIKLHGGEPANFLDIGGGAKAEKVTRAMQIILRDPHVKAILFNIFGGITRGDDVAKGIIAGLEAIKTDVPIVIRLNGTGWQEGRAILAQAGMSSAETMDEAATKVVAEAQGRVA